ncbi:MAG: hypothetical protein ACOZNI_21300 [Myxococcota bacterium]
MLVLLALAASASAADCLALTHAADLAARLDAAEAAYVATEEEAFERALQEAALFLPCTAEPIPPELAARYHRFEGLRLFAAGDTAAATAALRAARVLDPRYRFPDEILPPNHTLRRAYDGLELAEGATRRAIPPRGGAALYFDGVKSLDRPEERASVLQIVGDDGQAVTTRYLYPGQPLPPYEKVPQARNRLLAGSAVAVVAASVTYGLAWRAHDRFYDEDAELSRGRLEGLQQETVVFTVASGALFTVGLGGGVAAFLVRE